MQLGGEGVPSEFIVNSLRHHKWIRATFMAHLQLLRSEASFKFSVMSHISTFRMLTILRVLIFLKDSCNLFMVQTERLHTRVLRFLVAIYENCRLLTEALCRHKELLSRSRTSKLNLKISEVRSQLWGWRA